MNHQPDPLLTQDEVAAYLAISKRTVQRHVAHGKLPVTQIGRRRRFRVSEVDRAMAETAAKSLSESHRVR